jgi:hypothetical protein
LARRLGNSIRLATFPKGGESLNAAALVWSNAPVIVGAHDTGPLIRSKDGFWLAIPTPAAGKSTCAAAASPPANGNAARAAAALHLSPPGPSLLVAEGRLNSKGRPWRRKSKTGRGR